MANIDISISYYPGSQTATSNFMYDPPPSVSGKICKAWVALYTDESNIDNIIVKSNWSQINSVRVNYDRGNYTSFTATGTSGSNTLTYTDASISNKVGDYISGTGLINGTYITAINTSTKVITVNNNLSAAGSGTYYGYTNLNTGTNLSSAISDVYGNSDILSFGSNLNSASEHSFAYVRIPDGPHQVSISLYSEWISSNVGKSIYCRVHLEPMDNNYHYDRLTSNKTGPSIII